MLKINKNELNSLLAKIADAQSLYLPVDTEKGASYQKWAEGVSYSNALNTLRSPKDFFFPQIENMVKFQVEGKSISVEDIREENEDFVIFGVRACDVKSIEILDSVYLCEPYDSFYANRRNHCVIISMACTRPSETCFCQTFGINAAKPMGDISCWGDADSYYFEANTEKGKALLDTLSLEKADEKAVESIQADIQAIMNKLPLHSLTTEGFGAGKTDALFDRPEWQELSSSCLGCGTCTFVCPTCQCYDIRDFKNGTKVLRYRCWDSCMYSDFTKMAHGNPRLTQKERFRQRFMHKLVYYPTNNEGTFGCVGCGRCLSKCPVSMNIVKVMKTMEAK